MTTILKGIFAAAGVALVLYGVGTVAMWLNGKKDCSVWRKLQAGFHVLLVVAFAVFVLWLTGLPVEMFWMVIT